MSGAALPSFEQGEPLTAAALNALASRIRGLQQRAAQRGQLVHRMRRVLPGRHFAFQLAELNGCIWFRQGWLDVAGELVPVGDREWNSLGGMRPCTVWLNVTRGEDGAVRGAVVCGELDLTTPETNLHRRLGYVRTGEAQDGGGPVWYAVQVAGGVIAPAAPRRQMGTPAMGGEPVPEGFCRSDAGMCYMHAGSLTGSGYAVGEETHPPRRVVLGYSNAMQTVEFAAQDGGRRFVQCMGFATNI